MTSLYKIQDGQLHKARPTTLSQERFIEDWVAENPNLLGLDAIIIGRQVVTGQSNYIDLLGLDQNGGLIVIELKKNRTAREIVAQVLDYASWARTLSTPQVYEIAENFLSKRLATVFQEHFGERIPERLNGSHSLLIVAGELDPASRRIVEYLSEEHGVSINTAFFNVFESDGQEWLTTDFLLDQDEVVERSEKRVRPPWTGYYFVNCGLDAHRSWEDYKRYGFVAAGGGSFYSKRLDQLSIGDKIFAYDKGNGYIGYGTVTSEKTPACLFETQNGLLLDQQLEAKGFDHDSNDPDLAEYVVGVNWHKTFEPGQAKRFKGAFANQNVVCKLRDQATVDFLVQEFGLEQDA